MLGKLNVFARKIHRLCVVFIVLLGIPMTTTGFTMKYPNISPFNVEQARLFHGTLSTVFGMVFTVMIFTGLTLYLTPWVIKWTHKITPPQA